MTTRDAETKRTRSKRVAKTTLQYPIFKEMAELISDETWNKTYLDMSNGRFPISGLSIIDNHLVYRSRGQKKNKYELEIPNNVVDAIPIITEFLYEKLSVNRGLTQIDIQDYLAQHMKDEIPKWNKLKRIQKLDMLIRYAKEIKEKCNLSRSDYESLSTILINALEDSTLKADNIQIEEGVIVNIDCVDYDKTTKTFVLNKNRRPPAQRKKSKTNTQYDLLDRFKMILFYSSTGHSPETNIETGTSTS